MIEWTFRLIKLDSAKMINLPPPRSRTRLLTLSGYSRTEAVLKVAVAVKTTFWPSR